MILALIGHRCRTIRRFQHRLAGQQPGEFGPIEFTWDDGTHTTLNANTDWSLDLSSRPWVDPYRDATELERGALADEVGLWELAPLSNDLGRLVGQNVSSAEPQFNEVGELTGVRIAFDELVVVAHVVGGELTVEVLCN